MLRKGDISNMRKYALIFVLLSYTGISFASTTDLPKYRIINAIIGEAESEGYYGMLAIACAIRNRGTLKGVYGEYSRRVVDKRYSSSTYELAVKAYEESANIDVTDGATVWGNKCDVIKFKKTKWFKKYWLTKIIGNHYFYKER
jgi:hypothetical protein